MDGEISPDELGSLLDGGTGTGEAAGDADGPTEDLRIVDIRNSGAFERGHIPGSENIPAPELTDRVEELDGAERVVTVCPHGKASVQAARLLGSYQGVDGPVESLHGGLEAWDGPLETDDETVDSDGDGGTDDGASPAPF